MFDQSISFNCWDINTIIEYVSKVLKIGNKDNNNSATTTWESCFRPVRWDSTKNNTYRSFSTSSVYLN